MRTVYKYILQPKTTLQLPMGAKPLCVAAQGDNVCMWCEVHTENELEDRRFHVFGTGHPITEDMGVFLRYIGTAFLGDLVFHVYEQL